MMTRLSVGLLALGLLLGGTGRVQAAIAFTFPDPATGQSSVTGNDGFRFTPTVEIVITALGYYDRDQNGLTLDHGVAIFDVATQLPLEMTTVGPGTNNLVDLFQYVPIT